MAIIAGVAWMERLRRQVGRKVRRGPRMGRVTKDMPVYDTFGFSSSDLEQVREALEGCLGIRFVSHESSFIGNYYLHGERYEKGNLLLRVNLHPEDGAPLYSEFSAFPFWRRMIRTNLNSWPSCCRRR